MAEEIKFLLSEVIVTETVQKAFNDANKEEPVKLTLKAGDNGPLVIDSRAKEDVVVYAKPLETATISTGLNAAPIVITGGKRVIIDGRDGTITTGLERTSINDEMGLPVYIGEPKTGLVASNIEEIVFIGKGKTKDIKGNPAILRQPYYGELRIDSDKMKSLLTSETITIFILVLDKKPETVNKYILSHEYKPPEA